MPFIKIRKVDKVESKISRTNCPCYDDKFEKCLHPEAISESVTFGFKDEPEVKTRYCKYRKYYGATGINPRSITRKEYYKMLALSTICDHPEERIQIVE